MYRHVRAAWRVLRTPRFAIAFVFLAVAVFFLLRALPHWQMLFQLWQIESVSFARWLDVFFDVTVAAMTDALWWQNALAIALPILIATNVVFALAVIRSAVLLRARHVGTTVVGAILAVFGAGCAACGTLLLAPLISVLGLGAFFAALPLGGQEGAIIGALILCGANVYLIRLLAQPRTCGVSGGGRRSRRDRSQTTW